MINLYDKIDSIIKQNGVANIAIAGPTCSGKTSMAKKIEEVFCGKHSITIVKQDDYYKDSDQIPKGENSKLLDMPEAFHVEEFRQDIKELLAICKTIIPRYDINVNKRISKDCQIHLGEINIFEGLHTIYILKNFKNIYKIFLDTDLEICLKRRVERDVKLHHVAEERIKEFFYICILPMYYESILPQMGQADLIVKDNKI